MRIDLPRLVIGVALVASAQHAQATTTTRIPAAVQRAVRGCWSLSLSDTVRFEPTAQGLRAVQHRDCIATLHLQSVVQFNPTTGELGFSSYGRIHAALVVVHPEGNTLAVSYFSRGHRNRSWSLTGRTTATRCRE